MIKIDKKYFLPLILLGAGLFYVPFISRQFMSDDWLWLYNAKKALADPSLIIGRPMYGYFRPLNMVLMAIWSTLFGTKAVIFSAINILLHIANIWLLYRVLDRFGATNFVKYTASIIFAFYFLNSPAIEWIAVGHDLWVVFLCLLLTVRTIYFSDKPTNAGFIVILTLGLAAVLIKENGFVSLGLFYAIIILKGGNPISKKFRSYSIIFVAVFFAYLVLYFATRTYADKQIDSAAGILINIWYLVTYLFLPFSRRMLEIAPIGAVQTIKVAKFIITVMMPMILIYGIVKGRIFIKYFILWALMFISTIAIFKWNLGLFALYPEGTAARFMYSASPGFAVLVACGVEYLYIRRKNLFKWNYIWLSVIPIFVVINFAVVKKTSKLYRENQQLSDNTIASFKEMETSILQADTIFVLVDTVSSDPLIIESAPHLKAILDVKFGIDKPVVLKSDNEGSFSPGFKDNNLYIKWNTQLMKYDYR